MKKETGQHEEGVGKTSTSRDHLCYVNLTQSRKRRPLG